MTDCPVPSMGLGECVRLAMMFGLAMYCTWLCWRIGRGPDAPA